MKKLLYSLAAVFTCLALVSYTTPGEGYQVGDKAADFQLKNVDGSTFSMASDRQAKGFILVFTCNTCPVAQAYEDRVIALHRQFAPQGYPVVAINPNDAALSGGDSFAQMQKRAKDKNYPFVYLTDETQQVARTYGANRTPHVYILTRDGADFKVAYIGTIDDNAEDAAAAKKKYVEAAMVDILAGKPVTTSFTKAVGCSIKWKKA